MLGKKQLNQITYFNYITGVSIGSIAAHIALDLRIPFINGVISILWWCLLTFLLGYIALKSGKTRVLLDGEPTIVIKNGKILDKALKPLHINIDDLTMLLREQKIFSLQAVEYAIMEPNGRLSVLVKEGEQGITKKDFGFPAQNPIFLLPTELISDGRVLDKNLAEINRSKNWLMAQLKKQGFFSIENIFYAEIQPDGSLYIDLRDNTSS